MPVVLGNGMRLLENVDPADVQLEKLGVQEVGPRHQPLVPRREQL